jgi:hypothetical protein
VRTAFLIFVTLLASSASATDASDSLQSSGQIAKLATVYRCERGSWPSSIELLRAVEAGAIAAGAPPSTIPWSSITSATFESADANSLTIHLQLVNHATGFGCKPELPFVAIDIKAPQCRPYQFQMSRHCQATPSSH